MTAAGSVLFVDDDPDWVDLLRTAFERAGIANPVQGVKDGPEALSYSPRSKYWIEISERMD